MSIRNSFLIISVALLGGTPVQARTPEEIPFKVVQGFGIVVRGGIGSLNNLNFLLDSGAVPSVLSKRAASRMGITGVPGPFALLRKSLEVQYLSVDEVRFGSIRAVGLPMVVVDLAPFERLLGTRIDAIIGLDVLGRQNFGIDYKRARITFGLSGLTRHGVQAEICGAAGAPYWVLPITLDGQSFRVLLDTGADDLALFAGHTPKSLLGLRERMSTSADLMGRGTHSLQPLLVVLGDVALKRQSAVVLDDPPDALRQIDGVLGPAALGMSRIEFDWEHQSLRWDTE